MSRRTELKVIGVIFVVAIVGGAIAGTNQQVKKLFGVKFQTFNYPSCQTVKCSVGFYIGSQITQYSPPAPPGEKPLPAHSYLISPTFEGKNAMYMRVDIDKIAAASTTAGKGLMSVYGNCSGNGVKPAFRENLPNFGGNVIVCGSPAKIGNSVYILGYTAVFQSPKTGSFVIVGINENVEFNSKGQITNQVFDMSKYQSDIESILASLDVQKK